MSHVLMVDNYDSFTYNLVQAFLATGADVTVEYNDDITPDLADEIGPTHLVVSPGPGRPEDAGASVDLIRHLSGRIPILGVCLGHQAIAVAFGGEVNRALALMHGKSSQVYHDRRTIFSGVPNPFIGGRYHSLAVTEVALPEDLVISAHTPDGEVMGIRHKTLPVEGLQFHPESVLTPHGDRMLRNFLGRRARVRRDELAGVSS